MQAKVQAEYRMVKDLPPPSAAGGSKGGVTSAAPAAAAPSQGMLTDKSGSGAGGSTSLVVKSTPATAPVAPNAGRTLGIRRNQAGLDVPKPEWHAPWKLMRVVSGHLGWVRAIAIDPTNEWFVTGSADRTIKVWDLASGVLKLTLTGHISTIRGLAVSPRSPYLFSAGEDKMVKCWDLEYNRVIRNYHGHLSGAHQEGGGGGGRADGDEGCCYCQLSGGHASAQRRSSCLSLAAHRALAPNLKPPPTQASTASHCTRRSTCLSRAAATPWRGCGTCAPRTPCTRCAATSRPSRASRRRCSSPQPDHQSQP